MHCWIGTNLVTMDQPSHFRVDAHALDRNTISWYQMYAEMSTLQDTFSESGSCSDTQSTPHLRSPIVYQRHTCQFEFTAMASTSRRMRMGTPVNAPPLQQPSVSQVCPLLRSLAIEYLTFRGSLIS